MQKKSGEIKGKPTALAQLVAIHMANGMTSTKALCEETGYSDRAIRKAKGELETRHYSAGTIVPPGTPVPEPECRPGTIVPEAAPECRNQSAAPRTHAYKESSSKIVILEDSFPLNSPKPEKERPQQRGTRLPNDWSLPTDWRQWAEINFSPDEAAIVEQAEMFADYWQAKPGAQARKLDWFKTWKNWLRQARRPATVKQRRPDQTVHWMEEKRQRDRLALQIVNGGAA